MTNAKPSSPSSYQRHQQPLTLAQLLPLVLSGSPAQVPLPTNNVPRPQFLLNTVQQVLDIVEEDDFLEEDDDDDFLASYRQEERQ